MNGLLGLLHSHPLPADVRLPAEGVSVNRPGTPVRLDPITLSAPALVPRAERVALEGCVSGDIDHLYFVVGQLIDADGSVHLRDISFVDPGCSRIRGDGRVEADWGWTAGEGCHRFSLEWDGEIVAVHDGRTRMPALLEPVTFGCHEDESVYQVEGMYASGNGGRETEVSAVLLFREGRMETLLVERTSILGVTRMAEEQPRPGARFRLLEHSATPGGMSSGVPGQSALEGVLVFGDHPFTLVAEPAPAGEYVVGILAEDRRGTTVEALAAITVREPSLTSAAA